ncbi:shieldin complex subunit 3 [Dendropsophus ebraccatus]|uniref:shieldin complex subunit 3 n=1 Tax=Dendropsophus ebraccatus TaxID=150705 RepID=UPI0038314772
MSSALEMEVILHYRPEHNNCDVQNIAAGSLEEFPLRPLPKFDPWFPDHLPTFTLKPQKCPPFIPVDVSSKVDYKPFDTVTVDLVRRFDPTPDLLEFKANTSSDDDDKQAVSTEPESGVCDAPDTSETLSKQNTYVRSWSVCTQRVGSKVPIVPPSPELKRVLDRLQLNPFHRGRWTILPSVCGDRSLEEIWDILTRLTRHNVLPSCNATMQRDVGEIWLFCDLRYCEHIGKIVRTKLKLSGKMDLFVHKHGVILSM